MLKFIRIKPYIPTSLLNFGFARKKQQRVDLQQLQALKGHLISKTSQKYQLPNLFKHQDILYEQQLYGNKSDICGITQNNSYSCQFVLEVIGHSKPRHIILGGLNDTQARFQLQQPIKRFGNDFIMEATKLFCKSTLSTMIHQRNKEDINFYYDRKSRLIHSVNHFDKSIQVNNYIVAAQEVILNDQCKISYGKPSSIFIYEDLMLSLQLSELQQIFQRTINKVKERNHSSTLNKGAFILQQIKTYAMNQEPILYSKQITYTTALLNRLTKIASKNLLIIPNVFVQRIAQNCHNIDFPPEQVYRKYLQDKNSQNYRKLQRIISQNLINQILKKFALLGFLKGFSLESQLHFGRNIFFNSIFKDIFKDLSVQQILSMYLPLKKKYRQKIFQIQRFRVKNVLSTNKQSEFMSLQAQWNELQKRKQNFPYDYQVKNLATQQEDALKLQNLSNKIQQIVELQLDDYQKKLYQLFKKGNVSKEGVILYSKLVGKANVSLRDRVKLPIYHYGAFRGFYKQYYKDHLLYDQDKKFRKLNQDKIKKIQEKFQKVIKQVKDPYTLKKYISGQMGPVKQVNFDQTGNIQGEGLSQSQAEHFKKMIQQIDSQISKQMLQDLESQQKSGKSKAQEEFDNL